MQETTPIYSYQQAILPPLYGICSQYTKEHGSGWMCDCGQWCSGLVHQYLDAFFNEDTNKDLKIRNSKVKMKMNMVKSVLNVTVIVFLTSQVS